MSSQANAKVVHFPRSEALPLEGDIPLEGFELEEDKEDQENLIGEFDEIGWTPPHRRLEWEEYGHLVNAKRWVRNKREKKLQHDLWHLADILCWGLMEFGERFYQLFDETHYEKESLARIAAVGQAFERERRWKPDEVKFWVHYEVYTLDTMDADELLEQFANGELNRTQLREEANEIRGGGKPGTSGGSSSGTAGKDTGQGKLLDTCPLCLGAGEVTPDQRAAYFHEEVHG